MSTKTTNLGLDKPAMSDTPGVTIPQIANNFDVIDIQLAQKAQQTDLTQVNVLSAPSGYTSAKGDGVTDDSSAIQALINYVNGKGGGVLYFPPTTTGYLITPNLVIKDNVKLIGTKTKITFKSSASAGANAFSNFTDSLNLVHIEGFNFVTTKDYTLTDTYATFAVSNVTLVHIKNCVKLVLKDITSDSFDYTLKIDNDANISDLVTENVKGLNCRMFFLLNNVSKWTGRNLDSTLTNTTQLNHHYYLQRGLQNVDVSHVNCTNGAGYFFHFNDAMAYTDTVGITNIVFKHVNVVGCAYGIMCNAPVKGLTIRDLRVKNQTTNSVLTILYACANILIDGFRLYNCMGMVNSTASAGQVTNVQMKNGYIDKPVNPTNIGTIDNIILENIFYDDANCVNNSGDLTFTLGGTYVQCILKNIILNYPSTIPQNAGIRISGTGKFIFDNLIAHGAAANVSSGQFFYFPGTTSRTVTINRCESDMFGSFIYPASPDASVTLNKYNNLQKGATA